MKKISILFVCLGNICRSPLGKEIFRSMVNERGLEKHFEIDSCGTGHWHIGEKAHADTRRTAKKNGVNLEEHRARQLSDEDFAAFDYLIAMDRSNLSDMKSFSQSSRGGELTLLRSYDSEEGSLDVPDPYFGGRDGHQEVFDIIHRCCESLLDELEEELS